MKTNMQRIGVFFAPQQLAALEALATTLGISMSEMVRRIVDGFLAQQEKEKR